MIAVGVLALVVGLRYVVLRNDRQHTEQAVATLQRQTRAALQLLHGVQTTRAAADHRNALTQEQRDSIRTLAAAFHADLSKTRAETTSEAVSAFTSGSQANELTQCLTGVSQALNQLAVGDGNSILSLRAVEAPCRERGSRMTDVRARWVTGLAGVLVVVLLTVGIASGTSEQHRLDRAESAESAARRTLEATRVATISERVALRHAIATGKQLERDIGAAKIDSAAVQNDLTAAHLALDNARTVSGAEGTRQMNVTSCLHGIAKALDATHAGDTSAATAFLRGAAPACQSALAPPGESSPVMPFDFADPFVLRAGSEYYAFATNAAGGSVQEAKSSDLVHWDLTGNALANVPTWAVKDTIWAPAALQRGAVTVLYYTVRDAATSRQCISTAISAAPTGPFIDGSTGPLECGGEHEAIDPSPFVDSDGAAYLLFKSERPARIYSRPLAPDGRSFAGPATQLLAPSQHWEAGNVEAPAMLKHGSDYWLFYSGNDWNGASYAEGVARCLGPAGPCTPLATNPMLASHDSVAGPGGGEVFVDTHGDWWLAFHAYQVPLVKYPNSRLLHLARISTNPAGEPTITAP